MMPPIRKTAIRKILLIAALSALTACSAMRSLVEDTIEDQGPTLADLEPAQLPQVKPPVPEVTLEEIEMSYRSALEVAKSSDIRQKILVRLADIEMARSENRQLTANEQAEHFSMAISMYDELLAQEEIRADTVTDERLMYRLSKAYALDGRMEDSNKILSRLINEHPESSYAAEAYFRRAELAFSAGQYREAEDLYQQVIDYGDQTPFYLNAVYMHGWSQFKGNGFRASIKSFTEVLDRLLVDGRSLDELTSAQKSLASDTLRVMGITFTYLDGAPAITEIYNNLGPRHYQHLLYRQLGDFYLDKERYHDAASTYQHYIDEFPNSDHGPQFSVQMIEVHKQGGLSHLVLPAKEDFIRNYGVTSAYWAEREPEVREVTVVPYLETFLDELSSYYHAEAQALRKANAEYPALKAKNSKLKQPDPPEPAYFRAAEYYNEYLQTFPNSPRRGEMAFLMAEAYNDANALEQAVDAYELVAYEWIDGTHGAEAGYSAILVLNQLIEKEENEEKRLAWEERKIRNSINFADYFPADERATPVLTTAAEDLFNKGQSDLAVEMATRITNWQPAPDVGLQKTAWLILAHSQFDAGDFTTAEDSYRQVLARLPAESDERPAVIERIAASMFKTAEKLAAEGQTELAVEQFLAIDNVSPGSEIAISAQYDAGNYLMGLKAWQRAENVFRNFEQRFPQHTLTATIPPKLAVVYQELQQWDAAASVLAQMSQNQDDPEMRRQSLYLSAELFEKSGRLNDALAQYQNYVKTYPEPFDLATEARFKLVELSTERGDMGGRKKWLKELVRANDKAGGNRTQRSIYLAAFASNEFADEEFAQFERIKLTLPIKKSLKAKKSALDKTLKAYKKVLDYGVAEFSTEANYRIGNVYSQLSRDLMDSERPTGLDPLAMEQYEILLEEQAYPFEEKSIELLEANAQRAWSGFYDDWVKQSIKELSTMLPARYGKKEAAVEVSHGLH